MPGSLIQVAVGRPLDTLFTYRLPDAIARPLVAGQRLKVPFGRGKTVGFYVGDTAEAPEAALREVEEVIDGDSPFTPELFALASFAARYYRAPLGEVLKAALPPALSEPTPMDKPRRTRKRPETARAELAVASGPIPTPTDEQAVAIDTLSEDIRARRYVPTLLHGVTGSGKTEVYLRAIACALDERLGALTLVPEIALTPQLVGRFRSRFGERIAVLHSGLREGERLAEWQRLRRGEALVAVGVRSAIFAPVQRLGLVIVDEEHDGSFKQEDRFRYHARDLAVKRAQLAGCPVALGSATPCIESLHNARTSKYRLIELTRRVDDRPMPRIELVDLRECGRGHVSAAFPQLAGRAKLRAAEAARVAAATGAAEEARAPAEEIAWGGAAAALSAAAPGISAATSSPARSRRDALERLALASDAAPSDEPRGPPLLSPTLALAMGETLVAGRQTILFLNRRGHSTYLLCLSCGRSIACDACAVSMALHRGGRGGERLQCHWCGAWKPRPSVCPGCGEAIEPLGIGTERVEEEVRALFPEARVGRLDRDAVETAAEVTEVLSRFSRGEMDVLIGTQMVAKGHDFPGVTLVGILLADQSLNLPDFRASERTLQLLVQVAGRAGRGNEPGRVVVQTFSPDAAAIEALSRDDFAGFSERELQMRRAFHWPPFARLLAVRLDGRSAAATEVAAKEIAIALGRVVRGSGALRLLGPSPSPIARLKGMTRWQMLLKGPTARSLALAAETVEREARRFEGKVRVSLDFDPLTML